MEKVLTVPSNIESLREVEKLVDEVATTCKLNNVVYGNVLIATLEASNNAIVHGNKLDGSKSVLIKVICEDQVLHMIIEDQGIGFDYEHIPDPTAPENIENISGRGIFLMNKLSDKVHFEENGAKVELIFNLI